MSCARAIAAWSVAITAGKSSSRSTIEAIAPLVFYLQSVDCG